MRFSIMTIIFAQHETLRRKVSFIEVSFKLIEAVRLFVFIERDLAALNGDGPTLDPEVLTRNRRTLDQRIAQVAALIETDEELMEHPALAAEMVWLFDEVRASLSRHQERWPPESAAGDIEGYRASAEALQQRSKAFRLWCDTNLNY